MTTNARPLSPHVQIYRLPLLAITSITHRITGIGLGLGLLLLSCWLSAAAQGPDSYAAIHDILTSVLGRVVLFGFTAALFFHFTNGIRHLIWDTGKGLDLPCAKASNRVVIGVAAALTVLTWLIALA